MEYEYHFEDDTNLIVVEYQDEEEEQEPNKESNLKPSKSKKKQSKSFRHVIYLILLLIVSTFILTVYSSITSLQPNTEEDTLSSTLYEEQPNMPVYPQAKGDQITRSEAKERMKIYLNVDNQYAIQNKAIERVAINRFSPHTINLKDKITLISAIIVLSGIIVLWIADTVATRKENSWKGKF